MHRFGSNNPIGIDTRGKQDTIPFHPYYTIKDMFGSDSEEEEKDKKPPVKTLPPSLMHLHPSCLKSISDEEEEDKKTPVKKMTNSKHEELTKCLNEKTSEEDDDDINLDIIKQKQNEEETITLGK